MSEHRIFTAGFGSVYPLYVQKAERKGRTREEVNEIICWLTGYRPEELEKQIGENVDFRTFFAQAPQINPAAGEMKGSICGVRLETIEDPLMRNIRCLDKLMTIWRKEKPWIRFWGGSRLSARRFMSMTLSYTVFRIRTGPMWHFHGISGRSSAEDG